MAFDVNEWRRLMAAMPDQPGRWEIFKNAAHEFAMQVEASALDRTMAVDTLENMATAYGLTDVDQAQLVIAQEFHGIEPDQVPPLDIDWQVYQTREKANGGKKESKRLQILSESDFVRGFKPPDYLVDGILQRRFIYSLTGQTGHAKTAVALLIASLIGCSAPNTRLGNHRVEHGRVIYFVGENPDDVRMRVIAKNHRQGSIDDVFYIPGIFNITEMFRALGDELRASGEASLICVDTSAAYFLGNEELNNVQMGAHARTLRTLTTLPGHPTVLVLCHPIKHVQEPTQLLPRGGGAFLAEMDGNLTLWRIGEDMVELHHTGKFRGPDFAPVSFKLEQIGDVPSLVDAKGRQIKTVRAIAISQSEEDKATNQETADEDAVLAAMLADPKRSYADLASACGFVVGDSPNKKKVERILKRLEIGKPHLTVRNRHGWALTEKGKELAREVVLRLERERIERDEQQRQADLRF